MQVIIAEKPSVAREIAAIVGATNRKDGFIEGNGYAVTWAFGHLVGLAMPQQYGIAGFRRENLPILPSSFILLPRQVREGKEYKADPGVVKQLGILRELFGMAERIGEITVKEFTRCLVIRMHMVNALDVTAFNALEDLYDECAKKGIRVIFSHVNEQPMHVMEHAGFVDKVGRENFCRHIQDAIALAAQSTGEQAG